MRFRVLSKEMIADGPQYNGFYNIQTESVLHILYYILSKMNVFIFRFERKTRMESIHFHFFESERNACAGVVYTCIHDYVCEE